MHSESIILMYHRLLSDGEAAGHIPAEDRVYAVTREEFEGHLRAVCESKWRPVGPEELRDGPPGGKLLITFDDSCESHYTTALPLLRERRLPAVFFITVGEVGRPGCVTWEQLREMHEAGMSVQSHGYTHRFLTRLSESELMKEMRLSRDEIRRHLGAEATMLSFPGGRCNRRAARAARECGYSLLFGSSVGVNNGDGGGALKRVPITAGTSEERLALVLSNPGKGLSRSRLRFGATRLARAILGESLYGGLRRAALRGVS